MKIFNMSLLIHELQSGVIEKHKKYIFKFFTPILFIFEKAFFLVLIFGYKALNLLITNFIGEVDIAINFYDAWSYGVVGLTVLFILSGIFFCKLINSYYADGKDFWNRLIMIGFVIRYYMLLYSIIGILCIGIFSNLHFTKEIGAFAQTIYPDFSKNTNVTKQKKGRSLIVQSFRSPGAVGFLPLVPSKFKIFFKQLCQVLLFIYQILSILPLFLVVIHYAFVGYFIKKYFNKKAT